MKKSTFLIIFIVYLASIVAIGFLGMRSKVYDEVKYVNLITIETQVENDAMRDFEDISEDPDSKKKEYILTVNFEHAIEYRPGEYYIPVIITPHVTYDTGAVANSQEESIVFTGEGDSIREADGTVNFYELTL